jgi:hypothetical protein
MSVRDTIRKSKLKVEPVTLSTGQSVQIREFSGPLRAAYSDYMETSKANGGIKPEVVVAMAICEADGALAYDWQKPEDLQEIADHIGAADLDAISLKLFEISGLTKKDIDEAEKK